MRTPQSKKENPASISAKAKTVSAENLEDRTGTARYEHLTRGEKDILYWRYKLQKGFLIEGQQPRKEDMELMSDCLYKLEKLPHLEKKTIRATKINKVLKLILRLDKIPREDEFKFKSRSKDLLERWNAILEGGKPVKDAMVEASNAANNSGESQLEAMDEDEDKLFLKPKTSEIKNGNTRNQDILDNEIIEAADESDFPLFSDNEDDDDITWATELAIKRKQNKAALYGNMVEASSNSSQHQTEVIDLLSGDEDITLPKQASQSQASKMKLKKARNQAVIQDNSIETAETTPTTLKRRRSHNADHGSPSTGASATRTRKSRRINPSVQENENESSAITSALTVHREMRKLFEESATTLEKLATSLEKVAAKLKILAGDIDEQEITKQCERSG